jgi:hypothetical protein
MSQPVALVLVQRQFVVRIGQPHQGAIGIEQPPGRALVGAGQGCQAWPFRDPLQRRATKLHHGLVAGAKMNLRIFPSPVD